MQLKRLYIKDFKIFKDFTYEFSSDSNCSVNVLIGINGSGKSTILEAIAEIFSCVILGEKSKFTFELEYSIKQNFREYSADYKGFIPPIIMTFIRGYKNQKPEIFIKPKGAEEFSIFPRISNFFDFIPKSIIMYYSGYSEIMKEICDPHNKMVSENLRKGISSPIQFYYHEPKLFPLILVSLLSFEYGEVPEYLAQKAKIFGVQIIQIKLKKPSWTKSGKTINDFWGSSGEVKSFLDFVISKEDKYLDSIVTDDFASVDKIFVDPAGSEYLTINIYGQKKLFEIRAYFSEEKELFKVLHTMYLDDLLDDISFSLLMDEDEKQKTFHVLSEGEQQAITIKGLTELLSSKNALFLFDEPDTFMHPKWQRNFISEIEENVDLNHQNEISYLIATHSPQVLSTANPEKTFVKIIEEGQLVEQTPKHYGREISSILYNLMGVEERNETIRKDLSKLFMLIEDEEIDEAQKELERLTEILGETDVDIQNAVLQLNYLNEDETD